MADFVALLVDMGFERNKAAKAVEKTGNTGIEPAMEWIFANPDESSASVGVESTEKSGGSEPPIQSEPMSIDPEEGATATSSSAEEKTVNAVPQSYKCEDCGKIFSNMTTVEYHAAKTNHSNFSESTEEKKPLTAEEKAEQYKKIQELMKQKRAEREAQEKRDEIQKEKLRMASGKELAEAKQRLQEQEMKEIVEQRKREKLDDKKARDRVKAMIEADKIARKAKFAGGHSIDGTPVGSTVPAATISPAPSAKTSESELSPKKDYKEAKLQLRLPSGKTLVQTFGAAEPLASVRLYVQLNRGDGNTEPFNLMTNFPKRVFQGDDYDKPLQALGLVPSAVLMITKTQDL